jgi:glycosyltransferase involved in cell wall biosynthesis
MHKIITLNDNYSTTRRFIKADQEIISDLVKKSKNPEDKFDTVMFLPEGEGRLGEGGLRTKGYFKVGGIFNGNKINPATTSNHISANNDIDQNDKSLMPLITVVTVVYNGEKFLEETILSVINQTYDNVEYIIIDGGSTDRTLEIIKKYEPYIDYWISENDIGIYDAMNKGIDLAIGDWINFMNAGDSFYDDDVLAKVFVSKCYSDFDIVYGHHQVIYPSGRKSFAKAGLVKNLWKGSQFCHQATFITTHYHKLYKFNLCTKIVADFEFFYNAWKHKAMFKGVELTVARFEAGGVSDVRRIDSILGRWVVVDKSLINNMFYIYAICKELLKSQVKRIV